MPYKQNKTIPNRADAFKPRKPKTDAKNQTDAKTKTDAKKPKLMPENQNGCQKTKTDAEKPRLMQRNSA
jgi:hypothetical protein